MENPEKTYQLPETVITDSIRIVLICEALPECDEDYFYSSTDSLYVTNTIEAFNNAGIEIGSIDDIVRRGVYLTVAVKAQREGMTVPAGIIKEHSSALEEELSLFSSLKAILLMGDTAIKAFNYISLRQTGKKTIPTGSTYKIRKSEFYFKGIRVFPSYLPTGRNFLIEKSKRIMVAEDIRNAFLLLV